MIRVLVADDHAVVRRGLIQILDEAPGMVAAGEASTGGEVLQAVRQDAYDVLVLDISMPGGGGLEVLKQLKSLECDLPVLILSIHSEKQYATRALKSGAAGYLTKDSAPEELITAIREIAQGRKYITASLATTLAQQLDDSGQAAHETLSDRELQVMRRLASGETVTQIAHTLSLSVKTVSTYRTRILHKLALESTADIIRYALERKLVE
jgi:DNA-binding NarL/FixJ family response regulator